MKIQKNMSMVIRTLKDISGKTVAEMSAELEISRSALQEYLSGRGNPSLATIDHLAEKLGVDTTFLVSGTFSEEQVVVLIKLLDMLRFISKYSRLQRMKIAELMAELLAVISEDGEDELEENG